MGQINKRTNLLYKKILLLCQTHKCLQHDLFSQKADCLIKNYNLYSSFNSTKNDCDKLARIVTEMNNKQIEVEKDVAVMQRKKKMFMCIIHCLHSQHCYIHFISTEGEKLGYVFYSTVTEFINCLTILTNLLTIIFSILFDRWLKQRWLKQSL